MISWFKSLFKKQKQDDRQIAPPRPAPAKDVHETAKWLYNTKEDLDKLAPIIAEALQSVKDSERKQQLFSSTKDFYTKSEFALSSLRDEVFLLQKQIIAEMIKEKIDESKEK